MKTFALLLVKGKKIKTLEQRIYSQEGKMNENLQELQ